MDTIDAVWYAAGGSKRTAATVRVDNGSIFVRGDNGDERYEVLSDVQVSSRLGDVPRRLKLPDGGVLVINDNDFVDSTIAVNRLRGGWIHIMESRWRMLLLLLTGAVILLYYVYGYGLRVGAAYVAERLPDEYVSELSTATYENMKDAQILTPSSLTQQHRERVAKLFDNVIAAYPQQGADLRLQTHRFNYTIFGQAEDGEKGIANAFALPDGLIVVTDELVWLLTDDEIAAVLAHEAGHVYYQHGTQAMVRSLGLLALAVFLFGDIYNISLVPITLVNLKYSRDFEREADCFAYEYIKGRGLSPSLIATALTKLETSERRVWKEPAADEHQQEDTQLWTRVAEALSTHPDTGSRGQLAQQCGAIER